MFFVWFCNCCWCRSSGLIDIVEFLLGGGLFFVNEVIVIVVYFYFFVVIGLQLKLDEDLDLL